MSWELYLQNSSVHPFIYLLYMILGASSETSTGRVASEYLKDRVAMSETKSASSRFYSAREIRQVLKSIWSRYQEKGGSREARRAMEAQWGKDDIPSGKTWWKSESVLGINLKSVRCSSVSASGQCELGTKIGRSRGVPTSKSCLKEFVLSPLTVFGLPRCFHCYTFQSKCAAAAFNFPAKTLPAAAETSRINGQGLLLRQSCISGLQMKGAFCFGHFSDF